MFDDRGAKRGPSPKSEDTERAEFIIAVKGVLPANPFADLAAGQIASIVDGMFVSLTRREVYFEKPSRYPSAEPIPGSVRKLIFTMAKERLERVTENLTSHKRPEDKGNISTDDLKTFLHETAMVALGFDRPEAGFWEGCFQGGERRRLH